MIRFIIVIACAATLAACGGDQRDLERWVAETLERPAEPIEPIPPIRAPEPIEYAAYDLRDPFTRGSPQREEGPSDGDGTGIRPDPDRRREYLEGFPLDTLDMVGTVELEGQRWALLSDNEDVVHRVREGNYVGQNHGRIHQVHPDRVELVELIPDGDGWMEREAEIALE